MVKKNFAENAYIYKVYTKACAQQTSVMDHFLRTHNNLTSAKSAVCKSYIPNYLFK